MVSGASSDPMSARAGRAVSSAEPPGRPASRHARALILAVFAFLACSVPPEDESRASGEPSSTPATAPAGEGVRGVGEEPGPVPVEDVPVVVFLGDSLTAGLGLAEEQAYPALVEDLLAAEDLEIRAVNAGVSGDTTAGGARRIDWVLRQDPDVVVVALGGNDALRGLDPGSTEENLRRIVGAAKDSGARVLLAGMLAPRNLGESFTRSFASIFPRLAEELDVALLPFLLEGVALDPELNQPDGIHPNAAGQEIMARRVAEALRPLLAATSA